MEAKERKSGEVELTAIKEKKEVYFEREAAVERK